MQSVRYQENYKEIFFKSIYFFNLFFHLSHFGLNLKMDHIVNLYNYKLYLLIIKYNFALI